MTSSGTRRAIPGKVFLPGFDGFPCEDEIDYNNFISNDYDCATILSLLLKLIGISSGQRLRCGFNNDPPLSGRSPTALEDCGLAIKASQAASQHIGE
eukprot:scaffold923_cov85-Cylindrotheca_fusiformis.AAC.1